MDKNKIIEGAAKLVAKGAYDKAIKEYQKVLDADPRDVRVLQKMGELFQKKNDNVQAAAFFTRVAECYSGDGFFLKAVALYKQVLRLNPELVEVNLKLAELHQQLGLLTEAMAFFQTVVAHHEKRGDTRATFDTLKRMVDLDPENVASRLKLAELYAREGMGGEALQEFRRAADHFQRTGRGEERLRVLERIAALEPDNLPLARDLARDYLARGDAKRALAKLQLCFKVDPRDLETLKLLAEAFTALGHTSKTLSVYKELGKLHAERNHIAEARAAWARVEQLDPRDPDLLAWRAEGARGPVAQPGPIPAAAAPPPPPPPPAAPPLRPEQVQKLLTETDVYVKYGLHEKALEHLRRIFIADPENLEAHEKAYHIYRGAGQPAQASEQLLNVLRLFTRRLEAERAQPYLDTLLAEVPDHPEMPAFLAVLRPEGGEGDEGLAAVAPDDEMLLPDEGADPHPEADLGLASAAAGGSEELVSDDAVLMSDEDEEGPPAAADDEPLTPPPVSGGQVRPLSVRAAPEPGEDFGEAVPFEDAEAVAGDDPPTEPLGTYEAGFESEVELPPEEAAEEPEEEEVSLETPVESGPVSEELDEATFFLEQGLVDEAREILETVEVVRPGLPRTAALLRQLEEAEKESAGKARTAPPVPGPDRPPGIEPIPIRTGSYNLAEELAEELAALPEEPPLPEAADGDFQYSVDEVFSEFKKGLEKVVKPSDVDTHYDLGIAYKEMGLVDDAIEVFEVARKGCSGLRKEVDCLTMLALLHGMKGEWGKSVEDYRHALASEHASGPTLIALHYDLALAYESQGAPGRALAEYLEVSKLDPAHRDVQAAVARLAAVTRPMASGADGGDGSSPAEPGTSSSSKKRKVGYL
ncbi:MAG TPA: tetratricopeptide repeat protein [Myxococcaceae bacterium]|nr:tetratricopeptide repeat protein [Myxococcaceae bacterium]